MSSAFKKFFIFFDRHPIPPLTRLKSVILSSILKEKLNELGQLPNNKKKLTRGALYHETIAAYC